MLLVSGPYSTRADLTGQCMQDLSKTDLTGRGTATLWSTHTAGTGHVRRRIRRRIGRSTAKIFGLLQELLPPLDLLLQEGDVCLSHRPPLLAQRLQELAAVLRERDGTFRIKPVWE